MRSSIAGGVGLLGAAWPPFWQRGSSRFFVSSCRACSLNQLPSSRLDIPPITRWGSTRSIYRSTELGWIAHPIGSLSFTHAAHIWAARPIGSQPRTNSNAPVTGAVTTVRGSTSRARLRDRWTVPMSKWLQMARSSWTLVIFTPGQKASEINSTTKEPICRHEAME